MADIGTIEWTAMAGAPMMRQSTRVTAMRIPFSQSLAKTGTFAVLHFGVAFSIAYLLTGSLGIASAIALIEPVANTVAYLLHERAWARFTPTSLQPLAAGSAAPARLAPARPGA
jgi:uncharacterized membrane protein